MIYSNFYPQVEESLRLLSKNWKIPSEIYDLEVGKRDDVTDTIVEIDKVVFHIPTLARDHLYVLWKCLWPDCHNCCERQDRLPLTKDDIEILTKKLNYYSKIDFLKNETIIATWKHGESYDQTNTTRTQILLKRKEDETEEESGSMIHCRFLDENGCGIHPDKPGVCWMYPFSSYMQHDSKGRLVIHALFQFTGDCPGFYIDKSLDSMMPTLEEYSKKIFNYNMAFRRTQRENYCATSSVDLNTPAKSIK